MKGQPGRKRQYQTEAWKYFSIRLPKELWRAWSRYAVDQGMRRSELTVAHLEELLIKAGYLKVVRSKDPETGREVKSYQVVER